MGSGGLAVTDVGDLRVLTLANPPSNRLSPGLRAGLIAALASPPATCSRIVLAARGATFSSGLPLEPDSQPPPLGALCQAVETAPVPVIAALHGLVIGPGAELALSAHARVAAPGTRIAFPEIALGLCPEGGTTRRLPCRIGTVAALRLLLSGRAVNADEALALGLIDAIAADPVAGARTLEINPDRPAVPRADVSALATARRTHVAALPAALRVIACVEAAALLPPEAHLAFEAVSREDLEASAEAAALRSVARAERRAVTLPTDVAKARVASGERIALHGAAPELVTLASLALARGLSVAWHHPDPKTAAESLAALDRTEAAEQRAGRLSAAARAAGRARLSQGGDAPLHVYAASPVDPVPDQPDRPARLLLGDVAAEVPGLAFAPSGPVCELARPEKARTADLALAADLLRRLGLQPLMVGVRPVLGKSLMTAGRTALAWMAAAGASKGQLAKALDGFGARLPDGLPDPVATGRVPGEDEILGRWLGALVNEGLRLLDQGVALRPSDIDYLLVAGFGFPRWKGGPMHLADRRGLMALRADLRLWAEDDPLWSPAPLLDRLVRDGLRLAALDDRS